MNYQRLFINMDYLALLAPLGVIALVLGIFGHLTLDWGWVSGLLVGVGILYLIVGVEALRLWNTLSETEKQELKTLRKSL